MIEAMRLALTEQEETQEQMEQVLEDKLKEIQELSAGEKQTDKSNYTIKEVSYLCKGHKNVKGQNVNVNVRLVTHHSFSSVHLSC